MTAIKGFEYFPIKEHETYGITKCGKIFDLRTKTEKKTNESVDGYLRVNLLTEKGNKHYSNHRLLALTLIPNPENKPEVDHIDRNRQNNNIENLRWATKGEQEINKLMLKKKNIYKNIYWENGGSKKCPYSAWRIRIKVLSKNINISKRLLTHKYTLEEVKIIRDKLYVENDLPILD